MGDLVLLAILGFLLLFGAVVVYMVYANRRSKANNSQVAQSLGFTPIEPELTP